MNIPTPLCASLAKARLFIACAILCLLSLCAHSAVINLTLEQAGSPLAGQSVAAYKVDGTSLGVTKTTNASGAASFDVSLATPVKFRLSRNGTFVWSNTTAVAGPFIFSAPADTVVTAMRNGAALGATTVYAYDEAGTYLNYSRTTDAAGVARFSFAAGARVKFRVDADGQQKYSAVQTTPATFTYTLPGTMTLTLTKGGVVQAGKTVYAYNAAGVYTNYSRTTDAAGIARFCIDEGSVVKFRADDGGIQFFSALATAPVATSLDLPADTVVTVMRDGAVLPSTTVYVYDEAGTYLNYSRATDANGVARFSIAAGTRVKFRVDADGQQKFSAVQTASVTFTYALPGTMTLTLTKGGVVQAGKTVYVYNSAGAYTNYSRTTDANGVARFCIDDGSVVKFRADDGGVQFFSGLATAPTAATLDLTPETVVTVMRNGTAQGNTTVYAYDETGNYLNYSRATDANGVARFSIAAGTRVKFRVDCDGQQKYSAVQTAPATFTYSLPGVTTLTLTKGGAMQAGQTVYVYDAAGVYTNYSRTTDAAGVARFCIDEGSVVKFRADDGGVQFFSGPSTVPTAAVLDLPSDTVVTVMRNGAPLGNTTVYVYDEAGAYTNYSRATDAGGVVRFSLATGARVKFRVDADGQQKFSTVQTAPAAFTYALPGLTTLTLTKGGAVQAGQTVYVYDAAGVYTNYSRTTDAAGVARFCIDDGSVVKFRADDGGVQFFSGLATVPTAAALDLPSDTVVTVMRNGAPLGNTTVYVYDEAGAYTNYSRATDASGVVRFSLATGARVKFRVDADGQQKFSTVQTAAVTFAFTLPGTTTLTLTKGGVVQAGKTVYVYNSAGSYTNYSRTTDASGVARFCIDEGSTVKFRVDDGGVQHFSALQSTPTTASLELLPQIAPLVFSVPSGTYTTPQSVAITTSTEGVTIHYTTDGSDPSATVGTLYSGPVTIETTTTLKAIAFKGGWLDSPVTFSLYTLQASAPMFSPMAGTFTSAQLVTITSETSGATIRYTTDGSDPAATAGTIYSGPVAIEVATTLKAIAYRSDTSDSAVTSGVYTINLPTPTVAEGLRAWFRADVGVVKDVDNKVSRWTDISGQGMHVIQQVNDDYIRQPLFVAGAMNGQAALSYDSIGSATAYLMTPGLVELSAGSPDLTVITVMKAQAEQIWNSALADLTVSSSNTGWDLGPSGTDNMAKLLWRGPAGNGTSPGALMAIDQVQVITAIKSAASASIYRNGVSGGTADGPSALIGDAGNFRLGFLYRGQIAEVLVYNRALTDSERTQIETALKTKYINPDADGDGLLDAWEDQQLGTRSYGATDDPGDVSRTLLQSFQQNLSPWPAPTVASGLRAWYRADVGVVKDVDNKVSRWTDISGQGMHVIQQVNDDYIRQPLFVAGAMNGQAALSYDSIGTATAYLMTPGLVELSAGSSDLTVITVMKAQADQIWNSSLADLTVSSSNTGWNLGPWGTDNMAKLVWRGPTGNGTSPGALMAIDQVQVITAIKSAASASIYRNGVSGGTADGPSALIGDAGNFRLGFLYRGQIAEVLVYNRALSATERQQIEQALAIKYGANSTPSPVINSPLTATAQVGVGFSYQITATNNPTSFAATGLPSGLAIDATTGLISGTPGSAGIANVVISATNAGGTGSATLTLTQNVQTNPVFTSATLRSGHFERGLPFEIVVVGDRIASGNVAVDFLTASGGRTLTLPLALVSGSWVASGATPVDVPLSGGPGASIPLSVAITLQSPSGEGTTANATLPLLNDTTAPSITVDQPTTATIDAATTTITGTVSSDATELKIATGALPGTAVTIDPANGRFSVTLTLQEGPNAFTLVARDFLGNQAQVALALTRTLRAPVVVFTTPVSFGDPVNTTTLRLAGTVADASAVQFTINGAAVTLGAGGAFDLQQSLPNEGANTLLVVAEDFFHLKTTQTYTVYRITQGPALEITSPASDPFATRLASVTIAGTVGTSATQLLVNTTPVADFSTGSFSAPVSLVPGDNAIVVEARDALGNTRTLRRTITLDQTPPSITGLVPQSGFVTNTPTMVVSGRVVDGQSLTVNGANVALAPTGTFSTTVALAEGASVITLETKDALGNATTVLLNGQLDTIAPVVTINAPLAGATLAAASINVTGVVDDPTATLTINSVVAVNTAGTFQASVPLNNGSNTITVQARDAAGNSASKSVTVSRDTTAAIVAFNAPANGSLTKSTTVRVAGTVDDALATVTVNGRPAAVAGGVFEILGFALSEGQNTLAAVATDTLGNASAPISIVVTSDTIAPAKPSLTNPPAYVKADRVTLQGTAAPGAVVSLTGGLIAVSATADSAGAFSATVLLTPNTTTNLFIRATDAAGNASDPLVYTVVSDTIVPAITVARPEEGASLSSATVDIVGVVSDANLGPAISVNGEAVPLSSTGQFGAHVTLPNGPAQTIVITVVDLAGNQAQLTRTVSVDDAAGDDTPPSISVIDPAYDAVVPSPQINVTALISDESPLDSITIGGHSVTDTDGDGLITTSVTVDANGEFMLTAVDSHGLSTTVTHRVQVQSAPPPAPTIQRFSQEGSTSSSQVILYGAGQAGLRYEITGGLLTKQTGVVGADGKFVVTVQLTGNTTNHIQVVVIGANGVVSTATASDLIQDSIAPTVVLTAPTAAAEQVPLASTIQITFSEAIRAADIAAVQVRVGANVVSSARTLSSDGTILTLTPSAPFGESANVQVTVPATVGDLAGNTLGSAYVFAFKTADLTAPATPVVDALPARTSAATLTLTGTAEALSKITVSGAAAALPVFADATGHISLNVTLQANTANTLLVTATDAAGNVSAPRTVTITHEDQSLVLLSSVPAASAVNVALNTTITVTFNKAVDPASLTGVTLAGQVIVPTTVVANAAILTLTPTAVLENGKSYEIVIPATVADLFGNRLGTTRRIAFTTVQNAATPVPIVYSAQPEGVTNKVSATISGYSAPGTQVLVSGGNAPFTFPAAGVVDSTGLFTLDVPLQPNAQNTITLTARNAQDQLSAVVTALNVRQDSIAPTIVSTTPVTGATNVDAHAALFVQFSEAIQSAPLTAAIPAIRLFDAQNVVVPGNWTLSPDARSVTFYPTRELAAEAHFKLLIGTTVRDLAGNPLGAATEVDFTTAASTQGNRPATPVLDPLASTKTTAPSITLTGSAPAGAQLRVYGGQANASALVDANGRFSVTVSLVLNSLNPLALVAEVGTNTSLPATITITQSKHAASIRILSPQPNLEYNNRSITVAGVIDDPASVKSITVDGAPAAIAGRFFFHQVILDSAPGAKSVRAVATLQDNSTLEASASFTLLIEPPDTDTKLPIPRFIFPEEGDSLNGEVVEALLTVEEGVQLTSVDIDHVVAHQVVGNIFFIYAHLPQQGANTITVNATDAAGLVGTSSVNVTMDSIGFATAPTVDALPTLTNDRDITLTGTAEPGGTIVVMNGLVPVRTVVSPTGTYSVVVPLNPNAANHLTIFITDDVGNLSPVTTVDITHDDTPPTVVSTSPSAGQTGVPQNSPIEITFSEALNLATVSPDAAIVVRSTLGQSIQRSVNLSADGKTIRIVPSFKFLRSDTIKVDISGSIADLHGFALGTDQSFTFNTVAGQTTLSGIVIDPLLRPLANVKVGIVGTNLVQTTSSFGTFLLDDAPVGDQILYVDARPDPLTGVSPQGDARIFNYLEFLVPVRKGVDNGLGRPIFMVDTDFSTSSSLALTGENNLLTFTPATKDLTGFSITYKGGSARFGDGTTRGKLTATRIDAANIPDRLPSGAIPHFLVEIGPDDLTFDTPAKLGFPNAYNLAVGAEVIVFQFKYGVHNYTELGRAVVGANNRILTDPILSGAGFVGIVPADKSFDLTRTYLNGRVVDTAGKGLAGISVNAIAGSSYVVTDAAGNYSIPLPEVRIELIRTYATVTTDLGSRNGESPSLVFQSAMVNLSPSGVTKIPDIVVDSFFLGGSIRYVGATGARIPVTGLAYSTDGRLVSVDNPTAHGVDIFVYRRISAAGAPPAYDSQPYMRTTAGLEHLDDTFDASFALSFLGSLAASSSQDPNLKSQIPVPGDVVKIVAFDRKTGFYAESDLKIPAASEAHGGSTPLDVLVNLELRPPAITLDMNRVFFLDGIRRRANIPHRGIAFTNDEYVEFKTTWTTPAAKPLDRPELALTGRLRVNSIDYQTDYGFVVRGGEHFRVLELREAVVPDRLTVLQRDTDVGIETIAVSRDGTFVDSTLLPITVKTDSYGLAGAPVDVAETSSKNVELYILNLTLAQGTDGIDASGRFLPGKVINIGGNALSTDGKGFFGKHLTGSLSTGGIPVQADNSLATRFGEALTPVINLLDATPAGLVPSRGAQGNTVLINGAHFSPVATDNKVDFNGAVAIVQSASETQLSVIVPDLASAGDVTVTIAGKKSNGVHFDFLSVGINNGSFEDGTLRAFTLTGSGQVVERWKNVLPTHNQFMAFLDTMGDPRDGRSTLTTDPFEVPAGMQTLLFDYNFTATALLPPKTVADVLEFYIVTDTESIKINDLFSTVTLEDYAQFSGFEEGSGFRTAGILVSTWAGTGQRIRVRIVLKGRGILPDFIPGMNADDANPIGLGNNQGTGLFVDNFRLSSSYQPPLAPIESTAISITSDGAAATIASTPGAVPSGSRVYIFEMTSAILHQIDVGSDGQFTLIVPFPEDASSAYFLVSYATSAGMAGRIYSSQIQLGVDR